MTGVRPSFLDRLTRSRRETVEKTAVEAAGGGAAGPTVVQIDATALSRVFSAPMWLRDLGLLAWFLVGVAVVLVGLVWLLVARPKENIQEDAQA